MIFSKQEIKEKQPIFDNFARGWSRPNNKLSLSRIPCTNEFSIPQKYYLSRPTCPLITSWNSQASFRLFLLLLTLLGKCHPHSRIQEPPLIQSSLLDFLFYCLPVLACLFVSQKHLKFDTTSTKLTVSTNSVGVWETSDLSFLSERNDCSRSSMLGTRNKR